MIQTNTTSTAGFSPRNGEVILKGCSVEHYAFSAEFQSPQWGSNSKEQVSAFVEWYGGFQSPQWGSNSKVAWELLRRYQPVSVPAMGK